MDKTDVRLSVGTQLSSFTTISNPGAPNHYASSAYEPNCLKLIVKFSFEKVIFGEVDLGVGTFKLCKTLSFKYLLISKKSSALAQAVQNNCFSGSILEDSGREYPKLCQTFCLLNIS